MKNRRSRTIVFQKFVLSSSYTVDPWPCDTYWVPVSTHNPILPRWRVHLHAKKTIPNLKPPCKNQCSDPDPQLFLPDPFFNKQKHKEKPGFLQFCDFLINVNIPLVSFKQKNFLEKYYFLLASWKSLKKSSGSESVIQRYGSADLDP